VPAAAVIPILIFIFGLNTNRLMDCLREIELFRLNDNNFITQNSNMYIVKIIIKTKIRYLIIDEGKYSYPE
jgi:hypothetical protein